MSFPRYPKYKASGVEWLGDVPEHWDVTRLRYVSQCLDGQRIPLNAAERADRPGDVPYWGANSVVGYVDVPLLEEDLVLLGEDGAPFFESGKSVAFYSQGKIWPNNHVHVIRPTTKGAGPFIAMVLNVTDYANFIDGSTRDKLTQSAMLSIPLPWPTEKEQIAITQFLNGETAKIDALVAEQQRLMELLKEKRQAVISHAVTKGLNPDAPMKPSGIEWLGDVPAHWVVTKIKRISESIEQGWSPQCESFPVETDNEWGVLKVGCVNEGVFDASENKALPADLEPVKSLAIASGDLMISRANTRELVGRAAVSERDYPNLMLCDKLYRMRFNPSRCAATFVSRYLGCSQVRGRIELEATGASASMVNISQSAILDLEIAVPPPTEQRTIVTALSVKLGELEALIAAAQHAIDLLQERRTALISAAVTGQIDVRELAPSEAA